VLFGLDAFVEGDEREAGAHSPRKSIALQHDFMSVEGCAYLCCHGGRESLGHGEQQYAFVGGFQQTTLGYRPSAAHSRREVESSKETAVGDVQWNPR
jgi:hypothetical protein